MNWREKIFGAMLERTLENAQVRHLVDHYDLSRDSRLARAIVREVNHTLDAEERRRDVRRVRTGELLLRTHNGDLVLPLRTEEYITALIAGESWKTVRGAILDECLSRYLQLFPKASKGQQERFLRGLWSGRAPIAKGAHRLPKSLQSHPLTAHSASIATALVELDRERSRKRLQRQAPRPAHRPKTLEKLMSFLGNEAAIAPAIQEPLLLELVALRARFHPRITTLVTGQMPIASMHVDAGRTLWKATRHQPLASLVISVFADGELRTLRHHSPDTYEGFVAFQGRRMARVLTEAYVQDGLLSYAELQWIFLVSIDRVSRAVNYHQRRYRVILPCPGTVLDMGKMLTHKDLVVRLHLEGHTVLEIARRTFHSPRSVDAYLRDFDAVLILHLYGLPPHLIARVLRRGPSLVHEYLGLIDAYLKRADTMREYMRQRGIKVAETAPQLGP